MRGRPRAKRSQAEAGLGGSSVRLKWVRRGCSSMVLESFEVVNEPPLPPPEQLPTAHMSHAAAALLTSLAALAREQLVVTATVPLVCSSSGAAGDGGERDALADLSPSAAQSYPRLVECESQQQQL